MFGTEVLCFFAGALFVLVMDFIDYIWFDEILRTKIFKQSTYIYVLSDGCTWDTYAHEIRVTKEEIEKIKNATFVASIITDNNRWRQL